VELSSFSADVIDRKVKLEWLTSTEVDNYGFEIERKSGNKDWNKIGFIKGHGSSNSTKEYSFTDKSINGGGKFQYRLKQIDTDGSYSYSETVEVTVLPNQFMLSQNYPNPFNPSTVISFQLPVISNVKLKVYNILGNEVTTLVNEQKEAGYYEIEFNASQLPSGVYFYALRAGDKFGSTKKMLHVK
ncbi:MAG: T9SS type A sorting domain-containing protein, partial [bacterium]